MTPTARTLDLLRRSGYLAGVVEKWLPKIDRRQDLFGCFDVIGIHPVRREALLVQVTTIGNLSSRLAKVKATAELTPILASGVKVQVHGWRDGQVKVVEVLALDLTPVVMVRPRRKQPSRFRQGELF